MIDKTAEKEEFRVPLILTKSKNPFFVKVGIPFTFPNQRPQVNIMHKVVHPKIDPQTFAYKGDLLNSWGPHSSLVNLVR